jgi:hypothetical protein
MPEARKRAPVVPAKMKIVVAELLMQPKYDLAAAAEKAGVSHYWARRYLSRPTVLRYFREERAAMLEEICAGNPAALAKVRESSGNDMAIVASCRALELMRQTVAEQAGGARQPAPGLIVQIVHSNGSTETIGPPPPPMIDVTPEREALEPPG